MRNGSRLLRFALYSLSAMGLAVMAAPNASAIDVGTGPAFRRQQFEAWGTSLAWFANAVGGWSDDQAKSELMDLLFDSPNHLGLNLVRYNIGGGQNRALARNFRVGALVPGWVPTAPSNISDPATWVWDWNADPRQRWVLQEALARGVNRADAFSLSPPYWMTISQDTAGGAGGGSNLLTQNFDEYAHYQTEVVRRFQDDLGIHFQTLSPMNEAGANWWTAGGQQEGMHVSPGFDQRLLVENVGQQLAAKGLATGIAATDAWSANGLLNEYGQFNAYTKSFVEQINFHTYGGAAYNSNSALDQVRSLAQSEGKRLYMDEYGNGSGDALAGGITLANRITADLKTLGAQGWSYWQAIEPLEYASAGWGLALADYTQQTYAYAVRKQYHVMRQFTSHMRPGSHVVAVNDGKTLGAYDPQTDSTVLVITNDQPTDGVKTFNLVDRTASFVRVIQTTGAINFASAAPVNWQVNQVTVASPGNSVTTVVVHHQPNLVQNAEFTSGGGPPQTTALPGGWRAAGSAVFDSSINNSFSGAGAARLFTDTTGASGAVWQEGIGDGQTDLTGVAFQFSIDMEVGDSLANSQTYDAHTTVGLEFYGADGQALTHSSPLDFAELLNPIEPSDSYVVYRTAIVQAPPGSRFVRPIVRFDGVGPGSSAEVVLDNAYLQEVAYVPRAKHWLVDANASWTVDANWQLDATQNDAVYFGPAITAGRSVEVDAEQTLSSLTMDSPLSYRILGIEALRFNGGSAPAMIDVRNGVQKVFAPMALESDATVQVLVGAELLVGSSLNASGRVLTKTGPGTLDLAGGFQLQGGTLAIEAAAEPSVLIGDNALLDGTLSASLPPGVEAKAGDVFRLVEFLTPTSTFENIVLPALSESLNWKVEIASNVLTASVVLAADFDGSGQVDGDDLAQWQLDFGASSSSDADNDGDSDGADFLRWQQDLGSSIAQVALTPTSHVPEPAAAILALAAFYIIIGGCSRCVSSGIGRG